MIVARLVVAVALAAPAVVAAQTPASTPICKALAADVESVQMDLADKYADGFLDDSAPRATMRAAEQTAGYARAQIDLNQMAAHHCAPYAHVVSPTRYMAPALECRTAMISPPRDANGKLQLPDQCKRDNWKALD